ncbi:calcium/calmodulin-regulated receptor-like kinase 2 [Dendrobium catenatum]|uniref:Putative leucine-rich repeat receptor-like serine/threonine-protein kinase n=1 Tax=Dendrobium catenatum TaxID=906689 RepID=A0A2I0XI18_9ASPA|nr:calcium/calmodulin-regulated receptor-like kinase 2 [Dendrobium catenatum]XP_020691731.1 calcium/calmodulin-regulated receptor-like kinase 2 [Dendrobium catenatum]XP_028550031.1 calcium/calmodulin-regulated receptor-like kinase 2 [Dendrobium catenatum]XP_028550033.1 calcium/calmodulin-regulated receptor-like kinase 2 [Dendrobium catenatum]PKU87540.1 putative leucine-rich repeat receptor-like serine/threonine-protein kinase [Dendrobium catenatum]
MGQTDKIIIGVTVGVAVGIVLSCCAFFAVRLCRKRVPRSLSSRDLSNASLPIRANGIDSSMDSSVSLSISHDQEDLPNRSNYWGQRKHQERDLLSSFSGIPRYLYKDIQKATQNFTTILGQGSFGPVYKAIMPTGAVVAVKVLANKSKQGEKEFQTEVVLLSRLHHRNLVNLLGYCVDKGQLILVYEFMSNGSLASLLYGAGPRVLNWDERLQIALDVSHGIEYLHDGASPSVVHRDLKSANILLDRIMRAKVADFGLSKEEMFDGRRSGLKGTYGYMDPSYMSTSKFTKQSDVYSFGIILFELITAINPQQGLMEYINLAVIGGGDGRAEWDEIVDKKLIGNSNTEEIRLLANIAHRCLHKNPSRRPAISDITQAISRIRQRQSTREHTMSISENEPSSVFSRIAQQQVELSSLANLKEFSLHKE